MIHISKEPDLSPSDQFLELLTHNFGKSLNIIRITDRYNETSAIKLIVR